VTPGLPSSAPRPTAHAKPGRSILHWRGVTGAVAVEILVGNTPATATAALAQVHAAHRALYVGVKPVDEPHPASPSGGELTGVAVRSLDAHRVKLVEAGRPPMLGLGLGTWAPLPFQCRLSGAWRKITDYHKPAGQTTLSETNQRIGPDSVSLDQTRRGRTVARAVVHQRRTRIPVVTRRRVRAPDRPRRRRAASPPGR